MIFGWFTLLTALSIAGVAAWFSIAGLMAIFSASAIPIAIMASTLEIGKLVTASWLYRHWKEAKFLMKTYLSIAVIVLMLITSMGIFGFLSKAHLDQAGEAGNNELKITQFESKIDREQRAIQDAEKVIFQLDEAVNVLIKYDRIRGPTGSIAVRESQQEERQKLNSIIETASDNIAQYQEQLLPLREKAIQTELKVGPLKYVSELVYGESSDDYLDKAVRLFILMLVFVFDPLAVAMVIAANQTLLKHGIELEPAETKKKTNINTTLQGKDDVSTDINVTSEPPATPKIEPNAATPEQPKNKKEPELQTEPVRKVKEEPTAKDKLGFWTKVPPKR